MNNFEKIKSIKTIKEMTKFLENSFDEAEETFGCGNCTSYLTHHYPDDCGDCYWLQIGTSIEKWLKSEVQND